MMLSSDRPSTPMKLGEKLLSTKPESYLIRKICYFNSTCCYIHGITKTITTKNKNKKIDSVKNLYLIKLNYLLKLFLTQCHFRLYQNQTSTLLLLDSMCLLLLYKKK